jgi:membrane-associated protein
MAIAGDQVGYVIGRKAGPAIFDKPKSRLFNPDHVTKANTFFERHGSRTIVLARFVPIVRTFAPVVAGVGDMEYRTFVRYNVLGGLGWGAGIPLLGYFLGKVDFIKNNIEAAILAIVLVSLLPVILEFVKHRRGRAH